MRGLVDVDCLILRPSTKPWRLRRHNRSECMQCIFTLHEMTLLLLLFV
jgi:hypothetical protein